MFITDKAFWLAALERALKSAAQGALTGLGADVAGALKDFTTLEAAALGALGMALLSLLTSITTAGLTDGSPSAANAEILPVPGTVADPIGELPVQVESLEEEYTPRRAADE